MLYISHRIERHYCFSAWSQCPLPKTGVRDSTTPSLRLRQPTLSTACKLVVVCTYREQAIGGTPDKSVYVTLCVFVSQASGGRNPREPFMGDGSSPGDFPEGRQLESWGTSGGWPWKHDQLSGRKLLTHTQQGQHSNTLTICKLHLHNTWSIQHLFLLSCHCFHINTQQTTEGTETMKGSDTVTVCRVISAERNVFLVHQVCALLH